MTFTVRGLLQEDGRAAEVSWEAGEWSGSEHAIELAGDAPKSEKTAEKRARELFVDGGMEDPVEESG
jgi:hypothetical protein